MPLKHLTETVLVVLLALATIVTGVIVSTLPHIPDGFFPWTIIFVAAVLYPALVYPILKNNRADYAFRALHFAPVAITILWMFIEIAMLKEPRVDTLHYAYTWGWSAPAVAATFILLAIFCLQVIRRRVPRIAFLILLFAPFIASAYVSENYTHWDTQLAATLWKQQPVEVAQNSSSSMSAMRAVSSKGEKNLASSSVPEEEAWRQKLREVEQGKTHSVKTDGSLKGVQAVTDISEGRKIIAKKNTKLPKSGGEMEAMGLLVLAGFAGTVHVRARRRSIEPAFSV